MKKPLSKTAKMKNAPIYDPKTKRLNVLIRAHARPDTKQLAYAKALCQLGWVYSLDQTNNEVIFYKHWIQEGTARYVYQLVFSRKNGWAVYVANLNDFKVSNSTQGVQIEMGDYDVANILDVNTLTDTNKTEEWVERHTKYYELESLGCEDEFLEMVMARGWLTKQELVYTTHFTATRHILASQLPRVYVTFKQYHRKRKNKSKKTIISHN